VSASTNRSAALLAASTSSGSYSLVSASPEQNVSNSATSDSSKAVSAHGADFTAVTSASGFIAKPFVSRLYSGSATSIRCRMPSFISLTMAVYPMLIALM
jgi:hypothetical protein